MFPSNSRVTWPLRHSNLGTRPDEFYLDLVVAERHLEKSEGAKSENERVGKEGRPLQDVLEEARDPLLLIGEGGSGKTTSLLYAAARAADRAKTDQAAPIPIYVALRGLTKIDDVPDLHQLIADSAHVKDWQELSDLGIVERRRILFFFDAFNEMPEQLQTTCAVVLQRFVEKHKDNHVCLIGSRLVAKIEQLARPPSQFKMFEILRLTSDQVQGFLQELDLGSLYDRMPSELRDLASNPFMLLAIARTLACTPESTLPHNRGELFQRFTTGWMEREKTKRSSEYGYERVKEPLLAYLATRMTSAGQTSLAWANALEAEVETQLEEIYRRIKRRGGMPDNWKVDCCLEEIHRDGLLKRVNEQLHFMHQSVQEYFTAFYFQHSSPDAAAADERSLALVEFTPKLLWELVPTYALAKVPNHRFVSALLMMTGLLDDSTKIVEALAARNPILAAAAISSANRVDDSLLARLEQRWVELLEHDDLSHRIVACSCLLLASMEGPRVIQSLVAFALGPSSVGIPALGKLGAPDAVALELAERARNLPDNEYKEQRYKIGSAVKELQSARMVNILFEQWRASPPDSSARQRFEDLLTNVEESLLNEELQRIRAGASDAVVATDVEHALTVLASRGQGTNALLNAVKEGARKGRQSRDRIARRFTEAVIKLRNADDHEVAASLRSNDLSVRAAAAKLAAERRIPVGDVIFESLTRHDRDWGWHELISALVSLWDEPTAVSKLIERSQEKCWCVGSLNADLAAQIKGGDPPEAVMAEIERLAVSGSKLTVVGHETDGATSVWHLSPSSWGCYRALYQLRVSPERVELYDCNVAVRAFSVIAEIPGEASLNELRQAIEDDDPNVQKIAVDALVKREDQDLAARVLRQLKSATSAGFIEAALAALGKLRDREALSLINDLLITTGGERSDVHPVWGACPAFSGWGQTIHSTLAELNADDEIQQALDKALASGDPVAKVATLNEFSRWFFAEALLGPERVAAWRTSERLQRVVNSALRDFTQSVRNVAVELLGKLNSDAVQKSLIDALVDKTVDVQVAAGEALVKIGAQDHYERVTEVLLQVAKADHALELRQRAGKVLTAISGGVETLYRPIQAELDRARWERALGMIEATLEIIPEDPNLFWWRGYALRSLGRLGPAADSYQHASNLANQAFEIPQALARTFLDLRNYPRAMAAARRGTEIAPGDAEAQSILAWSSYKVGAIPEAVEAASKAVDLDPVHSDAIWIAILGHIRQGNLEKSRLAFQHAMRVRRILSPGLDTSFLTSFIEELAGIKTDNVEISRLMVEIEDALTVD